MNNESIITDLLVFHTCIPVDNFKEVSGLVEMQPENGKPPKSVEVSMATEFADRDTIIDGLSHPAKLLVDIVNSFTVIEPKNTDAEQGLQLLQKFYALFVIAIGKGNTLETSLKEIVAEALLNNVSPEKRGRLLPVLISRAIDALDTMYLMASDRKQSYNIANTSIRTDVKRLIDDIVTNTKTFLEMAKEDSEKALVRFVKYVQTKKSMHNALMYMSFKEREEVMKSILSITRFAPYDFDGDIVDVLPEKQKQQLLGRKKLIASSFDDEPGTPEGNTVVPVVQAVSGVIDGANVQSVSTTLPNTEPVTV